MEKQFLWVEEYRPHTIEECILPLSIKEYFQAVVKSGDIQNMLLCGSSGTGKTTVARALCDELNCDYIIINGSEESGIDVLRTKIKSFASTISFTGNTKVVILDEADYLNPNSTQPALRRFMEEFASNCRFIFTCNYKNRIIPALHSRCTVIEFKLPREEKAKMAVKFLRRVNTILDNEEIKYDVKVIAKVIEKHFPDFRRALNELQRYSHQGNIDEGILSHLPDANMSVLIEALKEKKWKEMRQWVVNNMDSEPVMLFRQIYDTLVPATEQIPQLVLIIAEYQYKAAFVADQEINLVACLTEIMASVEIK